MVTCAFCKQEFLKKSTLTRHLETAKYCNTGKEKYHLIALFAIKNWQVNPDLNIIQIFVNLVKNQNRQRLILH